MPNIFLKRPMGRQSIGAFVCSLLYAAIIESVSLHYLVSIKRVSANIMIEGIFLHY